MQEIRKIGLIPFIGRELILAGRDLLRLLGKAVSFIIGPKRTEKVNEAIDSRLFVRLTWLTIFGTLSIFVLSFIGSYAGTQAFAIEHGMAPEIAQLLPFALEGMIFIGIASAFALALVDAPAGWIRLVILAGLAAATYFNARHYAENVEHADPLTQYALGIIFPIVVFLAAEISVKMIRTYFVRKYAFTTIRELNRQTEERESELSRLADKVAKAQRELETASKKTDGNSFDEKHMIVAAVLGSRGGKKNSVTLRELAEIIGTSESYAGRVRIAAAEITEKLNGELSK